MRAIMFKKITLTALVLCIALILTACTSIPSYEGKTLTKVGDTLYADPAFTSNDHTNLQAMMRSAKARLAAFYGEQRSNDPEVIFCQSDSCAVYFAGTERRSRALCSGQVAPGGSHRASKPTIVIVRQGRTAENVLVHELSHVEHMARFGSGRAPTWFHEGVAVYMSDEPNCAGVSARGIDDLSKISTVDTWETYTNDRTRIRQTYCQAADEIRQWIAKNGKPALLKLMDEVKWGKSFDAAYGALQSK